MTKNIEISTDDIEELYKLPGFIPASSILGGRCFFCLTDLKGHKA